MDYLDIFLTKVFYQLRHIFTEGQPNGISKEYYPSGKLMTEQTFLMGSLNGPAKLYYESGKIKISSNYKNDVLDGKSFQYQEEWKASRRTFISI